MTNLDPNPELIDFNAPNNSDGLSAGFEEKRGTDYIVEVLEPRAVPLGGPRAMTVQRTIPQRARSLIGAWCFLDYFGPDDVATSDGMRRSEERRVGKECRSRGSPERREERGRQSRERSVTLQAV